MPDALFAGFLARQAFAEPAGPADAAATARVPLSAILADKPWGTREFGLYEPDGNSLHFYRDLA
jgi:hypothetical protein